MNRIKNFFVPTDEITRLEEPELQQEVTFEDIECGNSLRR
jgi:hypothetical protein